MGLFGTSQSKFRQRGAAGLKFVCSAPVLHIVHDEVPLQQGAFLESTVAFRLGTPEQALHAHVCFLAACQKKVVMCH